MPCKAPDRTRHHSGAPGVRRATTLVIGFLAIVTALLPTASASAQTDDAGKNGVPVGFTDVTVNLQLHGFYGSVRVRANGTLIGTCSVASCGHAVPYGSSVQLTPDGDITSWGSGPCQNVFGSVPCTFTAYSNITFHVSFLG
ncbi:hypothetical protein [Streptosporangium saharense]|uniref:Uncharacterized protein n=1 Tax=Streptosporangium saharense TaxID=1706840 RepID=A0A7W7QG00_9ACTN|nr:hypothetical protein [Streptosporangium saharense]MBB4912935.1 hypothetical protein [Streptosporangium saharense]